MSYLLSNVINFGRLADGQMDGQTDGQIDMAAAHLFAFDYFSKDGNTVSRFTVNA